MPPPPPHLYLANGSTCECGVGTISPKLTLQVKMLCFLSLSKSPGSRPSLFNFLDAIMSSDECRRHQKSKFPCFLKFSFLPPRFFPGHMTKTRSKMAGRLRYLRLPQIFRGEKLVVNNLPKLPRLFFSTSTCLQEVNDSDCDIFIQFVRFT